MLRDQLSHVVQYDRGVPALPRAVGGTEEWRAPPATQCTSTSVPGNDGCAHEEVLGMSSVNST